ncbi:MAG TPA: TolC family outer membrane protein [Marinagarivorans sp.]
MPLKPFVPLKLAIAFSTLGLLTPSSAYSDSLAEIYRLAVQNDAEYRVAQANYEADRLAKNVNRAGLLPQISASASYTENDISGTTTRLETTDPLAYGTLDFDRKTDTTNLSAQLDQPLFNAAAWYQYKSGKGLTELSEVTFRSEEQALILRTAEAYFDSLKAIDDLETAIAEEDALSHSLEQTKQRFEVGLTAITEVHEAQAQYDSAKANRLISEGALVIAFEALEVLTGSPHKQVAPLKSTFPVTPPEPADRESWVEMAKEANLDLLSAQKRFEIAETNYKVARSGHLPTLSARLGYSDTDNDGDLPSDVGDSAGTSATVTLSLPIFTGGRTSAVRQQAANQQVAAKETINLIERSVTQQTRSLHQRVNTGVATVHARQQAIVSNESALEATKAGYDVGTRNLVDVLNAQRRVYDAKRNFLSTLYDYVLSGLRLKQAAGTLSAQDLVQLDQWLNKERLVGLPAEK